MRATPGLHEVCVYARTIYGIGNTKTLGCRSVSGPLLINALEPLLE